MKIRAGLMDIKVLEQVSEAGLEQWRPAMKETFPLPRGEADKVCAALGVSAPPPGKDAFSLDEFLAVLAAPERGVRAVAVHKRRLHYTVNGCMSEVTEVVAEGREGADAGHRGDGRRARDRHRAGSGPRRIARTPATRAGSRPPSAWKAEGAAMPVYAVIDVGTNSVKFHIGERHEDGSWATIVDRAEVTRLGEGIAETGDIAPAAIARTVEAIAGMADEARASTARRRWSPSGPWGCAARTTATSSSRACGSAAASPSR